MAVLEALIAFSSIYVAGLISFGSIELCEESLGPLALRATIVAVVAIVSLIAMGLYQFHQRLSFGEAIVRIMAALVSSCLALAVIFYAFPSVMVPRELAGIAVGYAFILLLIVRYVFVRTVDENIFRRRTLIYGAGKRAASIFDLRRRADRRGFQIVGRVAAPGDKIVGDMDLLHGTREGNPAVRRRGSTRRGSWLRGRRSPGAAAAPDGPGWPLRRRISDG